VGEVRSADQLIRVFNGTFLPADVTIELGDTVTWQLGAGEHTVTSGAPEDTGDRLFDAQLNASSPTFAYTFDSFDGSFLGFFCRRHPQVETGFIQLATGEITFRVAVVDNIFNPPEAFIFEGDTVLWEHEFMEDLHTVTSGRSSRPQDNPGALFDEESSDARPIFTYQFGQPGEYPYFCIPHESGGMVGVVRVQKKFIRGDANREGVVDISDALAILFFLFLDGNDRCCRDAFDANDDAVVDIGDPIYLLDFLFSDGPALPKPFPFLGADRSEDELHCWEK
jgi:plastocyanin